MEARRRLSRVERWMHSGTDKEEEYRRQTPDAGGPLETWLSKQDSMSCDVFAMSNCHRRTA